MRRAGLSKSRETDALAAVASPDAIADAAAEHGCASVAYTYNDPVPFAEYAIDTAAACRDQGVRSVAVTGGFIRAEARRELFGAMDAVNVDLEGFTDAFYKDHCLAQPGGLRDVLETLVWLRHESDVWLEITTLLIPGLNDSVAEIQAECDWIVRELGADVPVHFTAFHPDFKMMDRPATPPDTLRRARGIAMDRGLHHAYTGNVQDKSGQATHCPSCGTVVIGRDGYTIERYRLTAEGCCASCGERIAGEFGRAPGRWGSRFERVRI